MPKHELLIPAGDMEILRQAVYTGADAGKHTIQNEIEDLKTQKIPVDKIRRTAKVKEKNNKVKEEHSLA